MHRKCNHGNAATSSVNCGRQSANRALSSSQYEHCTNALDSEFSPFTVTRLPISLELFLRSRWFFHRSLAGFKTKRSICLACLCDAGVVHTVDKTKVRRFRLNPFPSHFSAKMRNSTFWGSHAPQYNKTASMYTRFSPIQFYWKLKYESNDIS